MKLPTLPAATAALIAFLPAPALAQRHVWLVPGTSGTSFEGVGWDRAASRIIAATGDAIVAIDPLSGARETLYRTLHEDEEAQGPRPRVLDLVLGAGGAIDFIQEGPVPGQSDGRIRRLAADGTAQVIAGLGDAGPFIGAAEDAREGRFQPSSLAAGPHGVRYVADAVQGRVLLLRPRGGAGGGFSLEALAGAEGQPGPAYDPDAYDLDEDGEGPREHSHLDDAPGNPDPRAAVIRPQALAAAPDGSVFLADWSTSDNERPPWVFRLAPAEAGWTLQRLPVPGMPACECPPGMDRFPVRKPHRLVVADDGTLFVLGHSLVWSYTPLEAAGDGEPGAQWRCEAIAGPLSPKLVVDAWPPQGAPADQLDPAVLRRVRHLAAVPGGGLLLTDGADGIRFIGPAGDADLGALLRSHAQARSERAAIRQQAILEGLERRRDTLAGEPFNLPFRRLCRDATLSARLDADVLEVIGSFLVDPRLLASRAGMAARAIRAGGDGGPDPRRELLAQRHVWPVPGTSGAIFHGLAWDPGTGTLVAARGGAINPPTGALLDAEVREIRRLDPARGTSEVLLVLPPAGAAPSPGASAGPLPGHEVSSLVLQPDGAIAFTTVGPDRGFEVDGQVWRRSPKGGLSLLAGPAPTEADPASAPVVLEMNLCPHCLASGPGGELVVADREHGQVLLLTPAGADGKAGIRRIAAGLAELRGSIALGADGEVLLGGEGWLSRLVPEPGRGAWRLETIPNPGAPRCQGSYDPVRGDEDGLLGILALVPGRDGAFFAAGEGRLWAFTPDPAPAAAPCWRSELVTVSGRHALPPGAWDTDGESPLPVPPDFWTGVDDMAGIPGGGLVVSGFEGYRGGGIRFIGPRGDGALFSQVLAFRQAEADLDGPGARRILGALLRQRRLTDPEAFDLPFLALAHSGPGGAAPRPGRLGRLDRLPSPLRRLVGSYLVRPRVMAFRAGVAAEAILAESALARAWVAAGCPAEAAAGTEAGTAPPRGARRQRTEERKR